MIKKALELKKELSLSLPVIEILLKRGFTTAQQVRDFLSPSLDDLHDPFLFSGMERAVSRIILAIEREEPCIVYGDYDVDGISSIGLVVRNLTKLGGKPFYYVPNRLKEGYGLSREGLESIIARGFTLIITVDCGINATEEILFAKEQGVDVIVTDHHTPRKEGIESYAVINPKVDGEGYPFRDLAGVGVAFKLIQALFSKLGREMNEVLEDLDLVALGTIADVVPLIGENRLLAKEGLDALNKTEKVGLSALIQKSGLKRGKIGAYEIGFILGPRLNASGRIDTAIPSVELLLTEDRELAWDIALELGQLNRIRQDLHEKVMCESVQMVEEMEYDKGINGIVLAKKDWHEGVVGIAASKIAEKYLLPTILISTSGEYGKGSGRSVQSFSLLDALDQCKELLVRYGGHHQAAGITIEKEKIPEFRNVFNEIVRRGLVSREVDDSLESECELRLGEVDQKLIMDLNKLEPFGMGNRQPVFITHNIDFVGYPRIVGSNHLKVKVRENDTVFDAIGFRKGEEARDLEIGKRVYTIYYYLNENTYRGKKTIQLQLLKIEKDME
jgi:single-stranded-DNA-specific exonuclease